jgi:hypothetical protein
LPLPLPLLLLLLLLLLLQTPSDWENAGGHGTHVSGVALGGFPQKLLDADGKPLPFQRGVAFGAKLGAIRVSYVVGCLILEAAVPSQGLSARGAAVVRVGSWQQSSKGTY